MLLDKKKAVGDSTNTLADSCSRHPEGRDLRSCLCQREPGFLTPLRMTKSSSIPKFQADSERFRPDSGLETVELDIVLADSTLLLPKSQTEKIPRRSGKMMENPTVARMTDQSNKRSAIKAIAVGGIIAGTLDLLQACILFGWDIPLSIAGGLLGHRAFHGGPGIYVLGVLLHFFIACSAASTYYLASRRLPFLTEYPLVCGLFFGAAVQEVMNLIVLPLSALHARGPYELHDLILGLAVHMVVIGLPIAFSVRKYAR
jgi:hypothetical protein